MNLPSSHINNRRSTSITSLTPVRDLLCTTAQAKKPAASTTPTKSKRVRTGCLTCRERHLKCDEGLPYCLNCRKSNRECKRGVRLNFIDTQVKNPPHLLPPAAEWSVKFQDESRQIASEYVGGRQRYAHLPKPQDDGLALHRGHLDATIRRQTHYQQHHYQQQNGHVAVAVPTAPSAPSTKFFPPTSSSSAAPHDVYNHQSPHARPTPPESRTLPLPATEHFHSHSHSHAQPQSHSHSRHAADSPFPTPHTSTLPPSYYALQDHYASREGSNRSAGHRTSDASSVASIAPLATGPPPSFRVAAQGNLAQDGMMTPPPSEKASAGEREYLNSPDEIYYMQVFVEEVGVWMDSLDQDKHFSRLIPYQALKSPMLLNAFLACGVKHLAVTHPENKDKALHYYDTATTQLLRSLQNPDRNMTECATTAVVLNVYEVMSETPGHNMRMNHIAGARALIRECGWSARSTGVGAACFWLNIGMEVLSCLAYNWQTSWDPDQWGLNLEFANAPPVPGTPAASAAELKRESEGIGAGKEEEWVHRIFYIMAKIANFRATASKNQETSAHDEQIRLGKRLTQWQELKRLCDRWNNACPRTMRPFAYILPSNSKSKSNFPNIWLIKCAATIGRLFYHTAQCLLAQTNPMEPARASEEMRVLQLHHAHQVCGIAAHSTDRGAASVAIRSLAVAGAVLTDTKEQEEVIDILSRINTDNGCQLGGVTTELKRSWGWSVQEYSTPTSSGAPSAHIGPSTHVPPPARSANGGVGSLTSRFFDGSGPASSSAGSSGPGQGYGMTASTDPFTAQHASSSQSRVNPLSSADFSLPNHPYQNWYEPPNRTNAYSTHNFL